MQWLIIHGIGIKRYEAILYPPGPVKHGHNNEIKFTTNCWQYFIFLPLDGNRQKQIFIAPVEFAKLGKILHGLQVSIEGVY